MINIYSSFNGFSCTYINKCVSYAINKIRLPPVYRYFPPKYKKKKKKTRTRRRRTCMPIYMLSFQEREREKKKKTEQTTDSRPSIPIPIPITIESQQSINTSLRHFSISIYN